jgi:hypothetical protein
MWMHAYARFQWNVKKIIISSFIIAACKRVVGGYELVPAKIWRSPFQS